MSPGGSGEPAVEKSTYMTTAAVPGGDGGPRLRSHFSAELDQLRLQVEVMAVRVSLALDRMGRVLATGDQTLATRAPRTT